MTALWTVGQIPYLLSTDKIRMGGVDVCEFYGDQVRDHPLRRYHTVLQGLLVKEGRGWGGVREEG